MKTQVSNVVTTMVTQLVMNASTVRRQIISDSEATLKYASARSKFSGSRTSRVNHRTAPAGTTPTGHTQEWLGTTMEFDIIPAGTGTELRFRHAGLTPQLECWEACAAAWTSFMESIEAFATTGTSTPFGA